MTGNLEITTEGVFARSGGVGKAVIFAIKSMVMVGPEDTWKELEIKHLDSSGTLELPNLF